MSGAASVLAGFERAFAVRPAAVARAPGRVNLIGEHTDYNDGFVLPAAIGVETRIALRPTESGVIDVVALDFGGDRDRILPGEGFEPPATGGWQTYVRAVVAQLAREGYRLGGAQLAITGTIPKGAGLSSSASLEVGLVHALLSAAGQEVPASAVVAGIAQRAERDLVGMRCGIMDQLASAAGQADAALMIDCRSLAVTPVPFPADLAVMIVESGVVRGLVDGKYNERRAQCETAADVLGVAALRDATMDDLERARGHLTDACYRRARHVITDSQRVAAAAAALGTHDLPALGAIMAASHRSMRDDFEASVPPVDQLVGALQALIGPDGGARLTGGGFGGAVVAILPLAQVDRVVAALPDVYRTPDGAAPAVLIERPARGASLDWL